MGKKYIIFVVFITLLMGNFYISNGVGQITIIDNEPLYTLKTESINGSEQLNVKPTIYTTQAGLDIKNTANYDSILGVGNWRSNEEKPISKARVLDEYEHENKVLEIIADTPMDYGILEYDTDLTKEATFELWVNVIDPSSRDIFHFLLEDSENKYCVGFVFSGEFIWVPTYDMQDLQKTDVFIPNGWNHFLVDWTAGGLHKLYLNGELISTVEGGKSDLRKMLKFRSYENDYIANSEYIMGLSLSNEVGYIPFMAWNTTGLNYSINAQFSTLFVENSTIFENLSLQFTLQTNISTLINAYFVNSTNNLSEILFIHENTAKINYLVEKLDSFASDFFNNSGGLTLFFEGVNRTYPFLFNLSYFSLTIQYMVVESVEINFDLSSVVMGGYIALCFMIFLYLIVYRQKDEPVLIPFVLICSIPMFTDFWELGLLFICFFIYRSVIQIYQKMSGISVDNA